MEEGGKEYKKGLWTAEEDKILIDYINSHGKGHWNSISKKTGLKRCGKSCRLRWMNYLSPHVKRGHFTEEEEDLVIRLHRLLGNRWSLIAGRVPGRTDNQVKNYWNTHLSKKLGIKRNGTRRTIAGGGIKSNKKNATGLTSPESSSSIDANRKMPCTSSQPADVDSHLRSLFSDTEGCKSDTLVEKSTDLELSHDAQGIGKQQSKMIFSSDDYMMNSSLWLSEFGEIMSSSGSNTGSFTELINGHSFDLDWDQF